MNDIWDPKFIYMDAGSGEYQIEYLRKYGEKHPSTGLSRKIKRIQFAENLEVIDPVTGEVDKKQAKDFMINQTALLLEREQVSLSGFDDEFITQMTNYRVIGKSSSGKNVYSDEDHIIDSYMLSLLGFILNYSGLIKSIYQRELSSRVEFIGGASEEDLNKDMFFFEKKTKEKITNVGKENKIQVKKIEEKPLGKRNPFQRGGGGSRFSRGGGSYKRSTF